MTEILWFVPPVEEGYPNVGQYRFFKRMPIKISIIYPYLSAMGVTQLKLEGHNVNFMDCPTMGLEWRDLIEVDADYIILEVRTPIYDEMLFAASRLRTLYPEAILICFGDHVTHFPEAALQHFDYVISGGDYGWKIKSLIRQLEIGRDPERIFGKDLLISADGGLDSLPFCDREAVPWRNYYESWRHRETFIWTMSSRGCPYRCTFCAWVKTLWRGLWRQRSVKNVADEFQFLYEKYGELEILDDADCFNMRWGARLARELLRRGFCNKEILWAVQTHPNEILKAEEDLETLRSSGLRTVKLGIESGNQETLNRIRKGLTVKTVEKAVRLLKKAEIMVHANLMIGYPWENRYDALDSLKWIKKLDPNQAQFSLLIPYPNTELYDQARSNGWLLVGETDWPAYDASRPMLKMEGLTPGEIVDLYKNCWSSFYLNPRYIFNHIKKVRHLEGIKQLWRGFRSITRGHMRAVKDE